MESRSEIIYKSTLKTFRGYRICVGVVFENGHLSRHPFMCKVESGKNVLGTIRKMNASERVAGLVDAYGVGCPRGWKTAATPETDVSGLATRRP
jgi:hypothetical protein